MKARAGECSGPSPGHAAARRGWRVAASILPLAGLVLGLVLGGRNPNIGADTLQYFIPVSNWVQGLGFTYQGRPELVMPPGYGLLTLPFLSVTANYEQAGMALSAVAFAACIALAIHIGRFCFGRAGGLWAGVFVLLTPEVFRYSYITLSDMTGCAFYLLSLRLYLAAWQRGSALRWSAAFGLSISLAYLVRQEHFVLGVLAGGVLGLRAVITEKGNPFRDRPADVRNAWKRPALAFSVFLTTALPYLVYLRENTGRWTFSAKIGYNMEAAKAPPLGSLESDLAVAQNPDRSSASNPDGFFDYLGKHGREFALLARKNTGLLSLSVMQYTYSAIAATALGLLLALGLVRRPAGAGGGGGRGAVDWQIPFLTFVAPMFTLLVFHIVSRFVLPYALLLLTALGGLMGRVMGSVWARLPAGLRPLAAALPVAGFLSFSAGYIPKLHVPLPVPRGATSLFQGLQERHGHDGLRAAGLWLREHATADASLVIAAPRKSIIPLYYASDYRESAARSLDVPPTLKPDELAGWLESNGVDYLILEHFYIKTRPVLAALWADPASGGRERLRLVYSDPGIVHVFTVENNPRPAP